MTHSNDRRLQELLLQSVIGVRIRDRKYLNRYTPFLDVSLCIGHVLFLFGMGKMNIGLT